MKKFTVTIEKSNSADEFGLDHGAYASANTGGIGSVSTVLSFDDEITLNVGDEVELNLNPKYIGANHANVDSGDILSIIRKGQSALNRLFS